MLTTLETHGIQPTVLLLNKSPTVRKIIQLTLQRRHIRVAVEGNAVDALTFILNEKPAVIFLDTSIPDLDAYQFCQIIRKNVESQHIPVIFLHGKHHVLDKERVQAAGPTQWLQKPFNSEELLRAVKSCFL
jgi:twitching motility two-component system response regulator PilG